MYFGKQLYENSFSLISSSLPLTVSDTLIEISEDEFNDLSKIIGLQQILEKRKRLEDLNIINKILTILFCRVKGNDPFIVHATLSVS